MLLRADPPLATFDDGFDTTTGLGDLYGQALVFPGLFPNLSSRLLVGVGTGLVLPTATNDVLGRRKWLAAPAIVPVWLFPHLTVTPTLLWRLSRHWWTLIDAESTSDWELDGQTSFRAGLLLGRMLSPRYGISLKAELPFGGHPQTDWTLKAVFFATRF